MIKHLSISTATKIAAWLHFALLVFTVPVHAEHWYRLEVVLFEYTAPVSDGEWWYENPGLPERRQTIQLIRDVADPAVTEGADLPEREELTPYLALPERDYRMEGVRRALDRSGEYRPLLHVAWQQPGLGPADARAVRLDGSLSGETTAGQAAQEPGEAPAPPGYAPPVKVFDGNIRLRRSRFLHLDVDFAYFPGTLEQPELELAGPAGNGRMLSADYVRLTGSRRIKADELNYFDHPLFGLIVQVSRIELQQ